MYMHVFTLHMHVYTGFRVGYHEKAYMITGWIKLIKVSGNFFFVQGDVDTQTIEEYLELEKKIANAEHTRYLPIYLSIYLSIFLSIYLYIYLSSIYPSI